MTAVIQYILYLVILVALAVPLGAYIKKVMNGEKTFLSRVLTPCENLVYKVMRVNRDEQMNWKQYTASVLIFSGTGVPVPAPNPAGSPSRQSPGSSRCEMGFVL